MLHGSTIWVCMFVFNTASLHYKYDWIWKNTCDFKPLEVHKSHKKLYIDLKVLKMIKE